MITDRLFAAELEPSRKRFDDAIGLLHDAHVPALRYASGPIGRSIDYSITSTDGREWIDSHLAIRNWLAGFRP